MERLTRREGNIKDLGSAFSVVYSKLQELEDKIEDGVLVDMQTAKWYVIRDSWKLENDGVSYEAVYTLKCGNPGKKLKWHEFEYADPEAAIHKFNSMQSERVIVTTHQDNHIYLERIAQLFTTHKIDLTLIGSAKTTQEGIDWIDRCMKYERETIFASK